MNEINTKEVAKTGDASESTFNDLLGLDFIDHFENRSDRNTKRLRVMFKNGLGISIVMGEFTYGGEEGLYEIAPLNKDGELDGSFFDDEDQGDDVCGYCDKQKVKRYIMKIGNA